MNKYYIDLHKSSWGQWRASVLKPGSFCACVDSKFCDTQLEALSDAKARLLESDKEYVEEYAEIVIGKRKISH